MTQLKQIRFLYYLIPTISSLLFKTHLYIIWNYVKLGIGFFLKRYHKFNLLLIKLNGDNVKKFIINGLILTITALLTRSISMIFNIYVSNRIGSEATGLFSLIMSVYLFFITIATSGLSLACTYLVSENFATSNYLKGIKISKICNIFGMILGVFSSTILILLAPIISRHLAKQFNFTNIVLRYCNRITFYIAFFCH